MSEHLFIFFSGDNENTLKFFSQKDETAVSSDVWFQWRHSTMLFHTAYYQGALHIMMTMISNVAAVKRFYYNFLNTSYILNDTVNSSKNVMHIFASVTLEGNIANSCKEDRDLFILSNHPKHSHCSDDTATQVLQLCSSVRNHPTNRARLNFWPTCGHDKTTSSQDEGESAKPFSYFPKNLISPETFLSQCNYIYIFKIIVF